MSLKLAARLVTFPAYKIADIQENDTVQHIIDVSAIVPPGTVALLLRAIRMGGTGSLYVYPMSGTELFSLGSAVSTNPPFITPILDREILWKNTVANDDWDIYLFGYFVQKRTR